MRGMSSVWGADGCPGGWVVAELSATGIRWHYAGTAPELLALVGDGVLALDVPIGLPETGNRACDGEARQLLRGRAASSVFAAPHRGVLAHNTYASARPQFPTLSAQAFGLVGRIRDTDAALRAAGPQVHRRVVECHPEVSLRLLTGRELPGKKTAPGALLRLAALTAAVGALPDDPPVQAGLDDALDALACAWTARRWAAGTAQVLGEGQRDGAGLPMRIVA